MLRRFIHFDCPTLAHLVALLCRPTADNVPQEAALVVVDGLSALLNHALPRVPDVKNGGKAGKLSLPRSIHPSRVGYEK